MRLGFDLRPFLRQETGVGVYLRNLLFHLSRIDNSNEYFLFSASWKNRFPSAKIPPFSKMKFRDLRIPVKVVNFSWQRWDWPSLDFFVGVNLDLTHSSTPLPLPSRGKKVVTVHDLFFMDFPEQAGREAGRIFRQNAQKSFSQADGIITFSSFTKNELVCRFDVDGARVEVIPHGLEAEFLEEVPLRALQETKQRYDLPSSFLLFVGAQEPRKNLLQLFDALRIIHLRDQKIPLVLVGPEGQDTMSLRAKASALGLEPWIRVTGYLPAEEVRRFYRLATAFVLPSLCEGFGLPLLEAMASGLPVAASFVSAIPEVCRDAALYFQPEEPESMAEKISLLLGNEQIRKDLSARGRKRAQDFSWEKAADQTLRFYLTVAEKN